MKELIKDIIMVAVGAGIGMVAISQGVHANQPQAIQPQPAQPYQQRFVQIQQPKDMIGVPLGLLALDTKTGALCRSYEADFWKALPLCFNL